MHILKKLGALVAIFALSAIGAASAPAAEFTASETGFLTGKALEKQVFTTNGGTITCSKAATSGFVSFTSDWLQHVTVKYSECTAFGFATVDISDATYRYSAYGHMNIENWITVTPTFFGSSICTVTISPQFVAWMDYANSGTKNVKVTPTANLISYTSTGGSCGSSGSNGTLTGASEIGMTFGTLRYDA